MLMLFIKLFVIFTVCLFENATGQRGASHGCYNKMYESRKLFHFDGTVDGCMIACEQHFFRFAILNYDECTCSNIITSPALDSRICTAKCTNNTEQICGGIDAESYYDTDLKVPDSPRNLFISARTNTSFDLQWEPPILSELATEYIIEGIVLSTYADRKLYSPSWKFQNVTHVQLPNLHPATTYEITVIAASEFGRGGNASIQDKTIIGIPDPEPEEPKILKHFDNKIKIEIEPAINDNGPITWYRIVVHFVDSGVLQDFNSSLLVDYAESQEKGLTYYIAAELMPSNKTIEFIVGDASMHGGYYNAPLPPNSHPHVSLGIVSKMDDVMTVRYAKTTHEQHVHIVTLDKDEKQEGTSTLVVVLTIACILFALILIASIFAYIYIRKTIGNPSRLQRLSNSHEMSIHGPIVEMENSGYIPDANDRNFQQNLNATLVKLSEQQRLPRNTLTLDIDNIIGQGEFGDVIRGSLHRDDVSFPCQVHVVSDDLEKPSEQAFLRDLNNLIELTPHKNIIHFHGSCVTPDWMYLVMEDVPYTLKRHLLVSRNSAPLDRVSLIPEDNLLRIMIEIVQAMEYLSERKFIHKQLCAHNIKLTSNLDIKLTIFGPTLYDDQNKGLDLSRWLAPEVLKFQNHTTQSDVWSLGCLMWECCCLGGTLYPNINSGDLLARIKNGARPEQSTFIFDDLYQLLLNCWEMDPVDRPTFSDINTILNQLLTAPTHALSYNSRDKNGGNVILPYYLPLLEMKS